MSTQTNPKLLDEVRDYMRLHHYSIHSERTYCDWIKRYVHFHGMKSRDDLADGEKKIEAFLTHLAVRENVSPSTQNQAMNALVFLYKKVLKLPLDDEINAVRAHKKVNVPVVLSREETARVIGFTTGVPQLIVKLMYGSGLRISEAIRLRVQDIDNKLKTITVRSGKGAKDRITTFPSSITPFLQEHLSKVRHIHENDLAQGYGEVYMPYALTRKYAKGAKEWAWQYRKIYHQIEVSVDKRAERCHGRVGASLSACPGCVLEIVHHMVNQGGIETHFEADAHPAGGIPDHLPDDHDRFLTPVHLEGYGDIPARWNRVGRIEEYSTIADIPDDRGMVLV